MHKLQLISFRSDCQFAPRLDDSGSDVHDTVDEPIEVDETDEDDRGGSELDEGDESAGGVENSCLHGGAENGNEPLGTMTMAAEDDEVDEDEVDELNDDDADDSADLDVV